MLFRAQQFLPRQLMTFVSGLPAEHSGERRLHAKGRLVVKAPTGNAANESFLFLRIRLRKIVRKHSACRELPFGCRFVAPTPDPFLFAPHAERSGVGRL